MKKQESYHLAVNNFKSIFSFYVFILFCFFCFLYYAFFVQGSIYTHEPIDGFFYPANIIDHSIYYRNYIDIRNGNFSIENINNTGIAFIYFFIFEVLDFLYIKYSPEGVALVVNLFVLLFTYLSFRRIIIILNIDVSWCLFFILNCSFLYFAQLINKDVFTIFIFFKLVEYSIRERFFGIFIMLIFSLFIRVQISVIILVYLVLVHFKPPVKVFFILYISTSLFNGYLSRYQTLFINQDTLSDGVSSLVYSLNINYGIGSLFFNPLRLIQSFYSVLESLSFNYLYGIDVSKLKNIPQVLFLLIFSPWIVKCYWSYKKYMCSGEIRFLMALPPAFFMVWFLNPTINSRYVMLIIPFLSLLGIYMFHFRKIKVV